jgi:hypothetical protein
MDLKKSPPDRIRPISAISVARDVLRVHPWCKSRAHARISGDSPKSAESEGLNGGAEGYPTQAEKLAKTAYILMSFGQIPPNLPPIVVEDFGTTTLAAA